MAVVIAYDVLSNRYSYQLREVGKKKIGSQLISFVEQGKDGELHVRHTLKNGSMLSPAKRLREIHIYGFYEVLKIIPLGKWLTQEINVDKGCCQGDQDLVFHNRANNVTVKKKEISPGGADALLCSLRK